MLSWQAWCLNLILRLTLKRHGDRPLDLKRIRANTNNPPRRALHIPPGIRVEDIRDGELSFDLVDRSAPRTTPPKTVVLYLHGGGYFFGSPKTHRQALIGMAKALDAPVYGLDYRLAPEHPFPAAVDDAASAYRRLLARHPDADIVLAGDSAGGGLAIVTACGARDAGLRMPSALIAFSPWTDLANTGASLEANAKSCAMFTPGGVRRGAALYLGGADPRDPRASPLYADLRGLPPMLLFASRDEVLLDDTRRLAERARAAGVTVDVMLRDRLPHVWPIFLHLIPEGREAFHTVAAFAERLATRRLRAAPAGNAAG